MAVRIREFGRLIAGARYLIRPGGYATISRPDKRIGVVSTPWGYFLPGGGQEADESPEQAAVREAFEECGMIIRIKRRLGTADELVFSEPEATCFRKRCVFFLADFVTLSAPGEARHALHWLAYPDAILRLRHDSHRWAAAKALALGRCYSKNSRPRQI